MIDEKLEGNIKILEELIVLWDQIHDFMKISLDKDNISSISNEDFLKTKSKVAMIHPNLMNVLEKDIHVGQMVLDLVMQSISLNHLNQLSDTEFRKLNIKWHDASLLMNEVLGSLIDRREELAKTSVGEFKKIQIQNKMKERLGLLSNNQGIQLLLVILVIGGVIAGVHFSGVYTLDDLLESTVWTKYVAPVYEKSIKPLIDKFTNK
jgi:hypothetical protein